MRWCGTRTHTAETSRRTNVWGTRSQGLLPQWPPGIERGNDLEAPLMALRTLPDVGACEPLHEGSGRLQGAEGRRGQVEYATAGRQGLGTAAIAEQPVMAQALEAPGEHMQQEAPDKLGCWEAHYLDGVVLPIIAPAEVDDAVFHSDETLMADGDPMRIAPEVRHHLLGASAGRLRINDPLLPPEGVQPLDKRGGLLQRRCPRGKV